MSVDSIPQVAKAGLVDSSSVSDATRRSVSQSDVESFTLALNSTSNTTQASSITFDDVKLQIDKSLVNNMVQQMQEDRQKLKEAIEGEG